MGTYKGTWEDLRRRGLCLQSRRPTPNPQSCLVSISHDSPHPACEEWISSVHQKKGQEVRALSQWLCKYSRRTLSSFLVEGTPDDFILFCSLEDRLLNCFHSLPEHFYPHSNRDDLRASRILTGPVPQIELQAF